MRLSLVIPAYNEAERVGPTLSAVFAHLNRQDYPSEVLVVDDGSRDGTAGVVEGMRPEAGGVGLKLLRFAKNQGKGAAVRAGMLDAAGEYRFFYDADASTPIGELDQCWPVFEAGADVVIGSRALAESRIELRQAWYREHMGRMFNLFLRTAGLTRFRDTQCGFKGFTAAAALCCFSRQTIDRFSFDAEILFIAARHGLEVREVPVRWINSPSSKVNPLTDSLRMFAEMLRIRARGAAGRYD